jgi:hypothetical protein
MKVSRSPVSDFNSRAAIISVKYVETNSKTHLKGTQSDDSIQTPSGKLRTTLLSAIGTSLLVAASLFQFLIKT